MHESERNYNLVKILCLSDDQGNTLMSFVVVGDVYVSRNSHATLFHLASPARLTYMTVKGSCGEQSRAALREGLLGSRGWASGGRGGDRHTAWAMCFFVLKKINYTK